MRASKVTSMHTHVSRDIANLLHSFCVVIVEDNSFTRKVNRGLLAHLGIKTIHEAADGIAGLEAIRTYAPDLVIVDWNLPMVSGPEMVRMVRTPDSFPFPDVPIIILTCHGERWRVIESQRLGVHEFLIKPVSSQAILDRIVAIFHHPRPMVRLSNYYGPEPRGAFAQMLQAENGRQAQQAQVQQTQPPPGQLAAAP
jgi:DNA-binding response OmpR family regulator